MLSEAQPAKKSVAETSWPESWKLTVRKAIEEFCRRLSVFRGEKFEYKGKTIFEERDGQKPSSRRALKSGSGRRAAHTNIPGSNTARATRT